MLQLTAWIAEPFAQQSPIIIRSNIEKCTNISTPGRWNIAESLSIDTFDFTSMRLDLFFQIIDMCIRGIHSNIQIGDLGRREEKQSGRTEEESLFLEILTNDLQFIASSLNLKRNRV